MLSVHRFHFRGRCTPLVSTDPCPHPKAPDPLTKHGRDLSESGLRLARHKAVGVGSKAPLSPVEVNRHLRFTLGGGVGDDLQGFPSGDQGHLRRILFIFSKKAADGVVQLVAQRQYRRHGQVTSYGTWWNNATRAGRLGQNRVKSGSWSSRQVFGSLMSVPITKRLAFRRGHCRERVMAVAAAGLKATTFNDSRTNSPQFGINTIFFRWNCWCCIGGLWVGRFKINVQYSTVRWCSTHDCNLQHRHSKSVVCRCIIERHHKFDVAKYGGWWVTKAEKMSPAGG